MVRLNGADNFDYREKISNVYNEFDIKFEKCVSS